MFVRLVVFSQVISVVLGLFSISLSETNIGVELGGHVAIKVEINCQQSDLHGIIQLSILHDVHVSCSNAHIETVCNYRNECVSDLVLPRQCHISSTGELRQYSLVYANCTKETLKNGDCVSHNIKSGQFTLNHDSNGLFIHFTNITRKDLGMYIIKIKTTSSETKKNFVLHLIDVITTTQSVSTTTSPNTTILQTTPETSTTSHEDFTSSASNTSPVDDTTTQLSSTENTLPEVMVKCGSVHKLPAVGKIYQSTAIINTNVKQLPFNFTISWIKYSVPAKCKSVGIFTDCFSSGHPDICDSPSLSDDCSVYSVVSGQPLLKAEYTNCYNTDFKKCQPLIIEANPMNNRIQASRDGNFVLRTITGDDGLYIVLTTLNGEYDSASWGFIMLYHSNLKTVTVNRGLPKQHDIVVDGGSSDMAVSVTVITVIIILSLFSGFMIVFVYIIIKLGPCSEDVYYENPYSDADQEDTKSILLSEFSEDDDNEREIETKFYSDAPTLRLDSIGSSFDPDMPKLMSLLKGRRKSISSVYM